MISKMSTFNCTCTKYTQNKFEWDIIIVDDCSAYQKQKNKESDHFFLYRTGGTVLSFQRPIRDFDKYGPKVT